MAATRIKPIHQSADKTRDESTKKVLDYITDGAKTQDGLLVQSYNCNPMTADLEFEDARQDYVINTGRQPQGEVLAYHVRQAFKPGEITPEAAQEMGRLLAMEMTGGNNAFVVATHIDTDHVHNHILINAVNLDYKGKYRNRLRSHKDLSKLSDRLCVEHGYSCIAEPGFGTGAYKPKEERPPSHREILVEHIDQALSKMPRDFEHFLKLLGESGCKVKQRGKTVSIHPPGNAERFFRLRTGKNGLPDGYDEASLRQKIADARIGFEVPNRDDVSNILTAVEPVTANNTLTAVPISPTVREINTAVEAETLTENTEPFFVEHEDLDAIILRVSDETQAEATHILQVSDEKPPEATYHQKTPPPKTATEKTDQQHEQQPKTATQKADPPIKSIAISTAAQAEPQPQSQINILLGEKIKALIDIENSAKAHGSSGYENWAKSHNLQQAAQTLLLLQQNSIASVEELMQILDQAQDEFTVLSGKINAADIRLKNISALQKNIGKYSKTRAIYSQYLRSKRNKDFYAKNKDAIQTCMEAKKFFEELGLEKIPAIKELQAEYATLVGEKQQGIMQQAELRKQLSDLQTALKNVQVLMGISVPPSEKEQTSARNGQETR